MMFRIEDMFKGSFGNLFIERFMFLGGLFIFVFWFWRVCLLFRFSELVFLEDLVVVLNG